MFLLFVCVPLCFVYSSEGREEGVHHLLNEVFEVEMFQCVWFRLSACVRGDVELFWHHFS